MAIGKRLANPHLELFVATSEIRSLGNPFYRALNRLLDKHGFDAFAEDQCREFYAGSRGRPGVPPGVYFRMLMVGYLEGLGSERGIAMCRLVGTAQLSGNRTSEEPAGAFDAFEDTEAAERGGACGGVQFCVGIVEGFGVVAG